tara:strand:+ start:330 stop:1634 length:1305 start_codon:yes stop_codon:yes gene_type:complete
MAITINHQTNDIHISGGSPLTFAGEAAGGGGGTSSIAQLTDVDVSTSAPTSNQALRYNAATSKWEPADISASSGGSGSSGLTLGTVTDNNVDLSTGNVFEITADNQTLSFSGSPATHEFKLKVTGAGVVTGFGLETASYDNSFVDVANVEADAMGVALSADGMKMFICGPVEDTVFQYDMITAFDLNSASYGGVNYPLTQMGNPQDIFFNIDGTKMFICSISYIFQYTLTTGFDLSTTSYDSVLFDARSQETSVSAIAFSLDGTSLFLLGITNDTIYQYVLSTGFDVSTISYTGKSFSVKTEDSAPYGIGISNDGKKIFVVGGLSRRVKQFDLSTAFDLDTASYSGIELNINSEAGPGPSSIHFDSDGVKLFLGGYVTNGVYRYSMGTSVVNANINYPSSVTFPDDTAPALSETDAVRTVSLYTIDTGTNFYEY